MSDTAQLARLKRTRGRIIEVIGMTKRQEDHLREALIEITATIEEEERKP